MLNSCLFDSPFPEKLQEKGQREANVQRLQRELQLHQAQTSLQVLRSGEHRLGRGGVWEQGAVSFSLTYLDKIFVLQAICAKCSKTLDNKTSRVCPECFEASLSLENLGVNEQKRKAVPEVMWTNGETSIYISQNLRSFLLPVQVRLSNAVFQIVHYHFKGH